MRHPPPVMIIGAQGMLGQYLSAELGPRALPMRRDELDAEDASALEEALERYTPAAVIWAVGGGGTGEQVLRHLHGELPGHAARVCARADTRFVYLSSSRVFAGSAHMPYDENASPDPIDAYGRSKWQGEQSVLQAGGRTLVVRLPLVLGVRRRHPDRQIVTRLLARAREEGSVRIAQDVVHSPLGARSAARGITALVDRDEAVGVRHVSGRRLMTLFELAAPVITTLVPATKVVGVPGAVLSDAPVLARMLGLASTEPSRCIEERDVVASFVSELLAERWGSNDPAGRPLPISA